MAAPMHTRQCVLQLIKSVRVLASQDDFKDVASLFSDLASLRQNLDAGNDEVKRLNYELEVVRAEQQDKLKSSEENYSRAKQDFLRSHREAMAKVEQEKNDVHLEILSIRSELKDTQTEVDIIRRSSLSLQEQNANILNESYKLKADLAEAETEMQTLRMKIGAKDKKMESDKENLRQQGISVTKLRANLDASKQERQAFEEKFRQCTGQLSKITGFSQQLAADEASDV
jgi:chromosome segregation ATPase